MMKTYTYGEANKAFYERELQSLKQHDEVQNSRDLHGFQFINTAGHGYLVVPKATQHYNTARKIVTKYGFVGNRAVYLEEDCEVSEFFQAIGILAECDCISCGNTFITTTDWTAREKCRACENPWVAQS